MKRIFFNIASFAIVLTATAQIPSELNDFIPKITRPAPEAFSFTRYGDIPVGLFTGTMNYSVPLFQIQSGKISVPVTIDYSSNGVKVDDVSGRTGVDWNLKIGGVITRTIMGKSDDSVYTFPENDSMSWTFYQSMKSVAIGNYDTQADEYSYNFLGHSGKFYIDHSHNVRELSPSGLQISAYPYDGFIIKGTDGTSYYFETYEDNFNYSLYSEEDYYTNAFGGRTAWYLTKIKNIYGDSLEYKYSYLAAAPISYISGISQTGKDIGNLGAAGIVEGFYLKPSHCGPLNSMGWMIYGSNNLSGIGVNTDVRKTTMSPRKLTEVISKEGKLKLHYSSRDDLPGEEKLDSIQLLNRHNDTHIRSIGLAYNYSESSSLYNMPGAILPSDTSLQISFSYLKKRLFLDKVKFYNNTKSDSTFYKFE